MKMTPSRPPSTTSLGITVTAPMRIGEFTPMIIIFLWEEGWKALIQAVKPGIVFIPSMSRTAPSKTMPFPEFA
jgi:hypothetical protein